MADAASKDGRFHHASCQDPGCHGERREKAGIEWPHSRLRHSFCSHAVALHGFTWTSLQADHSERVLRDHYREVVTKFEADAYFAIHAKDRLQSTPRKTVLVHNNSPNTFN